MDPTQPDLAPVVVVVVTRTGGVAGLRRAWRAEPEAAEASVFIELIERCPWDASRHDDDAPAPSRGGDRFVWRISAHRDDEDGEREAELADDELTGAWRTLVDAVRTWPSSTSDRRTRPAR